MSQASTAFVRGVNSGFLLPVYTSMNDTMIPNGEEVWIEILIERDQVAPCHVPCLSAKRPQRHAEPGQVRMRSTLRRRTVWKGDEYQNAARIMCRSRLNTSQCSRRGSTLGSAKFLAITLKRLILHLLSDLFVPLAMRFAINLADSA